MCGAWDPRAHPSSEVTRISLGHGHGTFPSGTSTPLPADSMGPGTGPQSRLVSASAYRFSRWLFQGQDLFFKQNWMQTGRA